jgi:hypothetical protein
MKTQKTILALAIAAVAAIPAYGIPDGPYTANYGTIGSQQLVDFNQTLSVAKFNTQGGTRTLDSVSVTLSGGSAAGQSVVNTGSSAATFVLTTSVSITLLDFNNNPIVTTIPVVQNTAFNLGAGLSQNFGTVAGSDSDSVSYTSNLGTFIGAGNVVLPLFSVTSTQAAGGGGNNSPTFSTTAFANVSVTYNYSNVSTPVPEPRVYGAIGAVACLGLLGYRRLRARQAAQA